MQLLSLSAEPKQDGTYSILQHPTAPTASHSTYSILQHPTASYNIYCTYSILQYLQHPTAPIAFFSYWLQTGRAGAWSSSQVYLLILASSRSITVWICFRLSFAGRKWCSFHIFFPLTALKASSNRESASEKERRGWKWNPTLEEFGYPLWASPSQRCAQDRLHTQPLLPTEPHRPGTSSRVNIFLISRKKSH